MSKQDPFVALGNELDHESYRWLTDNHPSIAVAVETAILGGATPEGVRRFVLERLGSERTGLAQRCANAARWLGESK